MTADHAVEKLNKLENYYITYANLFHICTKLSLTLENEKINRVMPIKMKVSIICFLSLCGCMFDCNPFQKLDKYDSESLLLYEIFLSVFNHKIKALWINTLE